MGIFSALFGRSKLRKPNREKFFSIVSAGMSLEGRTDIRVLHKAGIVFNPVETGFFHNLDSDVRDIIRISGSATGTECQVVDDSFGTRWVVLDDPEFEDLVSLIHTISETIIDAGYGDRLIAAVFGFDYQRKSAYWVYNYKRGRFYPLVLQGDRQRDNSSEMRLGALMEEEKLPMEKSLEQWYALWGIPF